MIARGVEASVIRSTVLSRFGALAPEVEAAFLELSQAMALAGEQLAELDPYETIPLRLIPANRFLFGDDPAGRRMIMGLWMNVNEKGWAREVIQTWPDLPTINEIMDYAQLEYNRRYDMSPTRFRKFSAETQERIVTKIAWVERRY